jgi:hypothetical protein
MRRLPRIWVLQVTTGRLCTYPQAVGQPWTDPDNGGQGDTGWSWPGRRQGSGVAVLLSERDPHLAAIADCPEATPGSLESINCRIVLEEAPRRLANSSTLRKSGGGDARRWRLPVPPVPFAPDVGVGAGAAPLGLGGVAGVGG